MLARPLPFRPKDPPVSRFIAALVRHGEFQRRAGIPSARQPWPLTARGQRQAHAAGADLARVLRSEGWALHGDLYCARQLRAWESAVLIADALHDGTGVRPEIVETDALAERGLGAAANLSVEEIEGLLAADARLDTPPEDWRTDPFYRLPIQDAESLMEAGRRVVDLLEAAVPTVTDTDAPPKLQVFVGHGAAFRYAAHILGILTFDQVEELRLPHAQPVLLEHAPGDGWHQVAGTWHERGAATFRTRRRRRRSSGQ